MTVEWTRRAGLPTGESKLIDPIDGFNEFDEDLLLPYRVLAPDEDCLSAMRCDCYDEYMERFANPSNDYWDGFTNGIELAWLVPAPNRGRFRWLRGWLWFLPTRYRRVSGWLNAPDGVVIDYWIRYCYGPDTGYRYTADLLSVQDGDDEDDIWLSDYLKMVEKGLPHE